MASLAGLASDLEGLMLGELSDEDFRRRYPSELDSHLRDAIWGNLEHYLADTDIRAKDVAYRTMQDCEMLKLIRLLRDNAPLAELQRVSFLSPA
jgi:hypothetical protein